MAGSLPSLSNPQKDTGRPAVSTSIDQGSRLEDLTPGDELQVRLLLPADLDGSISHQQEQGFYPAIVPVALRLILQIGFNPEAKWTDLYFFQDAYRPPSSLKDKLLLAFGDPLQTVEIPWIPTSLVVDFTV